MPRKSNNNIAALNVTGFDIWDKATKYSIFSLVFLFPLFFFPFTLNSLELGKQFLLLLLVFFGTSAFLVKKLSLKDLNFNISYLGFPIFIFFAAFSLSTLFSSNVYRSFWGFSSSISSSFLALIFLVLFYFLIINALKHKEDFNKLFLLLIFSGLILSVFNLIWIGAFSFGWNFSAINFVNSIVGSQNTISIFFAALIPLCLSFTLNTSKKIKAILVFSLFLFLLNLVLINFKATWMVLAVEMFAFCLFCALKKNNQKALMLSSGSLLILSLVFLTLGGYFTFLPPLAQFVLPIDIGFDVAKGSLLRSPILGTGPGTFLYDYAKFKPQYINSYDGIFDITFEKGPSEILEKISSLGILGSSAFIFLLWVFSRKTFGILKSKELDIDVFALLVAFFGILVGQFVYFSNMILEIMFWLLLASFVALSGLPQSKLGAKEKNGSVAAGFLIFVLILSFVLFLSVLPKYFAQVFYSKGVNDYQSDNLELAEKNIKEAINIAPFVDLYYRDLSLVYLNILSKSLSSGEDIDVAGNYVGLATGAMNRAINIDPKNSSNWMMSGVIYQNLIGLSEGAEDLAIDAYKKAAELDPMNPLFLKEIGSIYIIKSDMSQDDNEKKSNIKLAKENLEKSISLKNNFGQAKFSLASALLREGNSQEAISILEELRYLNPGDLELAFQLGVVYFNNEKLDLAKMVFENILTKQEDSLDSRYFLGLIYDKQGNRQESMNQFEIIREAGENQQIEAILSNLKAGRSALDGLESGIE